MADLTLEEFLLGTLAGGPCVGITTPRPRHVTPPSGVEIRDVAGARTTTSSGLMDAFAEAWHFPSWFGRNWNAFNDFICDLNDMVNAATGRPPASAYLTIIGDAQLILVNQPDDFHWFANKISDYRDYYRDEMLQYYPAGSIQPVAFGLLLETPEEHLDEVRAKWRAAGVAVAAVAA